MKSVSSDENQKADRRNINLKETKNLPENNTGAWGELANTNILKEVERFYGHEIQTRGCKQGPVLLMFSYVLDSSFGM